MRRTLFVRLACCAVACALAMGLVPAVAFANEAPAERGVVELFADKAAEASARYAATGNRDDLHDASA